MTNKTPNGSIGLLIGLVVMALLAGWIAWLIHAELEHLDTPNDPDLAQQAVKVYMQDRQHAS